MEIPKLHLTSWGAACVHGGAGCPVDIRLAPTEAERRHSDSERSALGVFRVNALPRSCWKREHKKQQIHMVESNQKCYNLKDKMQDVVVGDRNS